MTKKIKLELTPRQFEALIEVTDTLSASLGGGDQDDLLRKEIKLVDKMLLKNGYKRNYN